MVENQRLQEMREAIETNRLAQEVSQSQRLSVAPARRQIVSDSLSFRVQVLRNLAGAWALSNRFLRR